MYNYSIVTSVIGNHINIVTIVAFISVANMPLLLYHPLSQQYHYHYYYIITTCLIIATSVTNAIIVTVIIIDTHISSGTSLVPIYTSINAICCYFYRYHYYCAIVVTTDKYHRLVVGLNYIYISQSNIYVMKSHR